MATFIFRDTTGMSKEQKAMENVKRAACRNYVLGSKDELWKIKERYKPANLRDVVQL